MPVHQAAVEQKLDEFSTFLERKVGVVIQAGSAVESLLLELPALIELRRQMRAGEVTLDTTQDKRTAWREMLGLADLAIKVVQVKDHPSIATIFPHLRLLATAPQTSSLAQNSPTSVGDDVSNKLFELLMALISMQASNDVSLASPRAQDTVNPDVSLTYEGRRWGLACKVPYSANPVTLLANVSKGVEQIERSAVDFGIVVLNIRNQLPHDDLFKKLSPEGQPVVYQLFRSGREAQQRIEGAARAIMNEILGPMAGPNLQNAFSGSRKALPFIAHYSASLVGIKLGANDILAPFSFLYGSRAFNGVRRRISKPLYRSLDRLVRALERAARWGGPVLNNS